MQQQRNPDEYAGISPRSHAQCLDYIDSQTTLIGRSIAEALQRRRLDDRPVTQELRGFAAAYARAKAALAEPLPVSDPTYAMPFADSVEQYLSGDTIPTWRGKGTRPE